MKKILNALGYQVGWWTCISSIRWGLELEAIVLCAVMFGIHLRFSMAPSRELKLGSVALLIGVFVDSMLKQFAVIEFYGWSLGPLSPYWLWALWILFAFTLNNSLAILKTQSLFINAFIGMIFGPLTYYAGAKLGAASFVASTAHIMTLSFVWMLAMPLLVVFAKRT